MNVTRVPFQMTRCTKSFIAHITCIRSLVRVSTRVLFQITRFTKSFIAHITLVRSLVRVRTHVAFQITRLTKTFLAHITFIRFLVRVNTHVIFQSIRMTKRPLAHNTLVRFLVRVNTHVRFQITRFTKALLAHITFIRSLVRVNTHVDFQLTRCTKLHLAHFTRIRFLVRVNAHVDFQSTRIIKTLLAHIALVLPSLSLHSFRSGNNKSLWHVMMILLHRDISSSGRTATEHPQQPKLFVSLFFFSSSPLLFLITFQNRLYAHRSFRMWILSSSSHYYCCLYPRIVVVACCCCSCLVFGASRTPKKRVRKRFSLWSRPFVFFKLHTLNNRKNQIFLFRCNTSSNLLRYCAIIHSRAFVASNDGRCLRFKPLILAEKERRSSSFFNHRFFLHIYIYI